MEEAKTIDTYDKIEIYEGQNIELTGFFWREAFPGTPNYESFGKNFKEIYWMLVLPKPITFYASEFEQESTIKIANVKKLQLVVGAEFYKNNDAIVLTNVKVQGKFFQSVTGHHHGDALFEVTEIFERNA